MAGAADCPLGPQNAGPVAYQATGDDIGWMQPSIYHRGLMVGETRNIDRIGNEGAIFMDYLAEESCTAGGNAFFIGMHPAAHRNDPAATARQPILFAARDAGARQIPA
jgi:hypothetical protein